MALPAVYPLAFLSDHLAIGRVTRELMRQDETSGNGRAQHWAAELAPPLWAFTLPLVARRATLGRAIDAKINALGTARSFLFADPSYPGPALGEVWRLATSTVTVAAISTDRRSLRLAGLPSGFRLSIGDRMSIAYGADGQWQGDILDPLTAGPNPATPSALIEVNPPLPAGVAAGAVVELVRPILRVRVGSYTPFAIGGSIAADGSLQVIQKV